ncbi:MAG: hypothetical protein ACK5M3_10605 [Dysgonomonas sp.]
MTKIKYGIAVVLNILLVSGIFSTCIHGDGELSDTIFVFIVLTLLIAYNSSLFFLMTFLYKNENRSKVKEVWYTLFYLWPIMLYGILWMGNIV